VTDTAGPNPPHPIPTPGPGVPTAPIDIAGGASAASTRLGVPPVEVPDSLAATLSSIVPSVSTDPAARAEASRDWWPLAMTWAVQGQVPAMAGVVVRPDRPSQVPEVLRACNEAGVPVTAAAGRSGVCGSSIPLAGGVVLDLCGLDGIVDVEDTSLVLDVLAGTFGDRLEHDLREEHGLTLGHWPQSINLSTVGGWLACRGAGQFSTRYGKIEDMVIGLDVALADGTLLRTGGNARQSTGPDLNQLFVGSEGTLGIITGARMVLHPAPVHEASAAWGFTSFADGLDACRRILRRGATPACLRLYDPTESQRHFGTTGTAVLLALDEGDPGLVDAMMTVVHQECRTATQQDPGLVDHWFSKRNDVAQLEQLISGGLVVDTMEVTGPWAELPAIYDDTVGAIERVDGTLAVGAHQSHAYPDGACLYFTFAGKPGEEPEHKDAYYRAVWDAGTRAVLAHGGALSHHHGIGINRARFMREALGTGLDALIELKKAFDPKGILNPGKLGLPSPFGSGPSASFADQSWS